MVAYESRQNRNTHKKTPGIQLHTKMFVLEKYSSELEFVSKNSNSSISETPRIEQRWIYRCIIDTKFFIVSVA
jgi:hypothetical protein